MPTEPAVKRAAVFADGQNLFHAVREAFGVPDATDSERWHRFWAAKLAVMGRQGIVVFSRSLRYRSKTIRLPDGTTHAFLTGEEKGIDVRLALDVIRLAHRTRRNTRGVSSTDWIRIARAAYDTCLDRRDYRIDRPDAEEHPS